MTARDLHARRLENRRRLATLALWWDVRPDDGRAETWAWVERQIDDGTRRGRRTAEALRLRYVERMTYDAIGTLLRPPVSVERVRQILARAHQVLRHPTRYAELRARVAMELDNVNAPPGFVNREGAIVNREGDR